MDILFRRKRGCVGFVASYSWTYQELWLDFLFWGVMINWGKEKEYE
jgi:hypothetical protein